MVNMMSDSSNIFSRKNDHIRINLNDDVRSGVSAGFENFTLQHSAMPEVSLKEISTKTKFLGMEFEFPFLISSMTGGTREGAIINENVARAAEEKGIGMGLGSQRAVLEKESVAHTFSLRKFAPTIPIFANIGAVQLNYGVTSDDCIRLVDIAEANGLIFHLNPLQEALQPEGDTDFSDLLIKIEAVCKTISVPVIVKEVGWGISADIAEKLISVGVAAIDVAGSGGTSWSQVEMYRSKDEHQRRIAADFRDWGLPTAYALYELKEAKFKGPVIASGGLQNGIDVAKSLALGADLCGMAGRILRSATVSPESVLEELDEIIRETRIAMFACGANSVIQMKNTPILKKI